MSEMRRSAAGEARRIVGRETLTFQSEAELRSYYEAKYRDGGYKDAGHAVRGVDISARYHAERLAVALRLLNPQSTDILLDAGCGNGTLAAALSRRCQTVHAIDIAANALDSSSAAIPNLRFSAMNVEALAFPTAHFDRIVCVETLEHVLQPHRALSEIARVLKPGGTFVLTYPTINRTLAKRCGLGRRIPISEHLNEWSYAELKAQLVTAGFRIQNATGIAFDFGPLLALKQLGAFWARAITDASLHLRRFPGNSMFVALQLTR